MKAALENIKEIADKPDNKEILLNYFSEIFDRPEKIDALKRMILNLAIQGNLVPYVKDESINTLIAKNIKNEKYESKVSCEQLDKWRYLRLGDVINITSGKNLTKKNMCKEGRIPVYGGNGIVGYHNKYNVDKETVVIGRVGFHCGSIHLTTKQAWITDNAFITNFDEEYILKDFLVLLLRGTDLKKNQNATAQPVISGKKIYSIIVGIPPINEQRKIVDKFNVLIKYCDVLQEKLTKKVQYKELSARSVFNSIALVSNTEELEKTLKFIIENFKELSLGNNAIKELRNCILQLAVQGMLAEQNKDDEPVESLLKKIKDEKEILLKQMKLKKVKTLEMITENEQNFKIPENWKWVRLDEITSYIQRGKLPKYSEMKEIPVVSQKCIQWSGFEIGRAKFIDPNTLEKYSKERFLENGDLLWNSTGAGTLGRINIYLENKKYNTVVADSHVTVIRPIKKYIDSEYLYIWLAGPGVQSEIEEKSSGSTKQIELSTGTVRSYAVPLPPIEEQKRIVKKVKILLEACEILEAKIKKQEKLKEKLLKVLIK